MSESNLRTNEYEIPAKHELRFEIVTKEYTISIMLIDGHAEVYGAPMELREQYLFGYPEKICVYSQEGCRVLIEGQSDSFRISKQTGMTVFLECHQELELLRLQAQNEGRPGPKVMIAGRGDTGKDYLAQVLLNYSTKSNWTPIYANITPGGLQHCHGMIEHTIFDETKKVGMNHTYNLSTMYHYGYKGIIDSTQDYINAFAEMANDVGDTLNENEHVQHSGLILNTCGLTKGFGYSVLLKAVDLFKIDIVYFFEDEVLLSSLQEDLTQATIMFKLLPNCHFFDLSARPSTRNRRTSRIHKFFFNNNQKATRETLATTAMNIYLPRGKRNGKNEFCKRKADKNISKFLLGISSKQLVEAGKLRILGLVFIEQVDETSNKVQMMSTLSPLPKDSVFLLTNIYEFVK